MTLSLRGSLFIGAVLTLAIATRNAHKLQEIQLILGDDFAYCSLRDFRPAPTIIEDASTFAGNASKKSIALARWFASAADPVVAAVHARNPLLCLADDSGLEVDALNGAPGVHSARFAALDTPAQGNSSDEANNAKLLRLLAGAPAERRGARFRCVIAMTPLLPASIESSSPVCYADEAELSTQLFEGICEGSILESPRGQAGFGYDPLFVPVGYSQTFAELGDDVKNQISHRARALRKLRARLDSQF